MNDRPVRAGDIYLADLDPIRGSEQAGQRPVLVISVDAFNERSRRAIICPITSNMTPWTTKLPLPASSSTKGMVLTDQVRSIDRNARILRHIETVPTDFVLTARAYVGRLIGLDLPAD